MHISSGTVANIISFISLIISIIALVRVSPVQRASVEMQIRELISNARCKWLECAAKLGNDEILKSICEAYLEDLLNAYDEACAKYNDNKIDRKRFRKTYFDEITQLYETPLFKEQFQNQTTRFQSIRKVYNEWNNREK